MYNHFNIKKSIVRSILLLIILCTVTIFSVNAQDIDWAIKPVITDVDEIDLSESKQSKINLIKVKKGKLWGIKNIKNDIIVPIEYKSTAIWSGDKYCEGRNGRDQSFFDQERYEVEFEEVDELNKKMWQLKYLKEKNENLARLNKEFPKVSITIENTKYGYSYVATNKVSNDTISHKVSPKNFFVSSSLYSIQYDEKSKNKVIKNEAGEIVKTFELATSFVERKYDLHILRQEKLKGLFDVNFKEILPIEYDRINILGENFVGVSKDGKTYNIADRNGNIIPNISGTSIHTTKGGITFVKKSRYEIGVFNEDTKTVEYFDWSTKGKPLGESNVYRIINKDTLSGLYDFDLKKEIVPCQFRRASIVGSLFVGGNYSVKKREMISRKYELKSIFNAKGELILKDSIKRVLQVTPDWIFVNDKKGAFRSFDGQGNLLETLPEDYRVSSKDGKFISIQPKGKNKYVHVNDYKSDKKANEYDSISKPKYSKDKKTSLYIVSQDGKKGVADGEGNIVIPIQLESIELEYYGHKYVRAKFDGKWGAIHNPLYQE